MASLRFPSTSDFKTSANTIVVDTTTRLLSGIIRSDNNIKGEGSETSSMNTKRWINYEIPDNESHAATRSTPPSCWDTSSVWSITSEDENSLFPKWNAIIPESSSSCTCNSSLMYRLLYYCKLIVYKVGRSYYALPMLLLLFTLLLGIGIGYYIGTRCSSHIPINRRSTKNSQSTAITSILFRCMISIHMIVANHAQKCKATMNRILFFIQRQLLSESTSSILTKQTKTFSEVCCRKDIVAYSLLKNESNDQTDIEDKERVARIQLKSDAETHCESGLQKNELPYHIAVVMDGNRRYGMQQYNNPMLGHWDGSKKLLQFVKWCLAEHIGELTVYALSTENWSRDTHEIKSLMNIIVKYCEELRIEAIEKQISIRIHSTDPDSIPLHVREVLQKLENDTKLDHPVLRMNICLSYGSRGEIVNACRSIVTDYVTQLSAKKKGTAMSKLCISQINEDMITQKLLLCQRPPDICIRTSGEVRLSNFLLWQMAYTELFFIKKHWPEIQKEDFLQILRSYANNRQRRFGR